MTESTQPDVQVERRKTESESVLLHITELQRNVKELKAQMTYHHGVFEERVENAVEKVFDRSFPDGDPEGHRKVHENWIKEAEAKAKFWESMKTELGKWGLIGFVGWVLYYVWLGFLQGPKK